MAKTSRRRLFCADQKLEKLILEARALKQRKAALDREIDKVKDEVKEYMDEEEELYCRKGLRLLATFDWRKKTALDSNKLEKEYRKAFKACMSKTWYRPFELK